MKKQKNSALLEAEQFEKIKTRIYDNSNTACRGIAREIDTLIREKQNKGESAVLGLATGSTPVNLYRELIKLHKDEGLSFKNVHTFNLDEYYPIEKNHRESYNRFMHEQLFHHIDIPKNNIHLIDGNISRQDVFTSCQEYENAITAIGGIDLQILGIGRTGHIGFNEPGSTRDTRTRLVSIDRVTRLDAARDFLGEINVPRYAITMGVGTILEARKLILMAWGESKSKMIARAVEGPVTESLPASFIQEHPNARFIINQSASAELTRVRHPWLVGNVSWKPSLSRRAVVWLSQSIKKPVLKLIDGEYSENGMAELLTEQGPAYNLNIRIFNELQHTITGWPGGKPNADDSSRPERAQPFPKRVVVFSPEPQDDVLYMGGTLHRLTQQGHNIEVVYQTSGNLAVPDEEAVKFAEFLIDSKSNNTDETGNQTNFARQVVKDLKKKGNKSIDTSEVRRIKAMIRRGEARAACRICGLSSKNIHFLDLPFYEQGRYRQFNLSGKDGGKVTKLLNKIKPHQIYATGWQADPNSVSFLCFESMRNALQSITDSTWLKDCFVWLYHGAEKEWLMDEIEMAVPLSPNELAIKINAIYQHVSQRRQTLSTENKLRESWQNAESRNQAIAKNYDHLGLAEYEAIETFKRWHFD
jgi:glucosamine-6-phosphate deaminase